MFIKLLEKCVQERILSESWSKEEKMQILFFCENYIKQMRDDCVTKASLRKETPL